MAGGDDAGPQRKVFPTDRSFRLAARLRSVRFALRGIAVMIRTQHNAWLHAVATVCVVGCGCWLDLGAVEWCCLVLAMASVWTAESLNTAFEFLADVASPEFHPLVEQSKDVAAGAVLITSLGAVIIGLLILGPRLLERL